MANCCFPSIMTSGLAFDFGFSSKVVGGRTSEMPAMSITGSPIQNHHITVRGMFFFFFWFCSFLWGVCKKQSVFRCHTKSRDDRMNQWCFAKRVRPFRSSFGRIARASFESMSEGKDTLTQRSLRSPPFNQKCGWGAVFWLGCLEKLT